MTSTEHAEQVRILEARIRHVDLELSQARVSIGSWRDKYERDLKEQRRVFDKFLTERGLSKDYSTWYSEHIA